MPTDPQVQQLVDRVEIAKGDGDLRALRGPERSRGPGVDVRRGLPGADHPGKWMEGRESLVVALHTALDNYERTSHHLGNIDIDFTGPDDAIADSTVIAWHRRRDGSEWTLYGRYVDKWVRTPDGWRMTERELRAAGAALAGTSRRSSRSAARPPRSDRRGRPRPPTRSCASRRR